MNPDYRKMKTVYDRNYLSTKGEYHIKQDSLINRIIIPPDSLTNVNNKNRHSQYQRLVSNAKYTNYPSMALTNAKSLLNKGEPIASLPPNMKDILTNSTKEQSNIYSIQNEILSSVFYYGLAGLRVVVTDQTLATQHPVLEVVKGKDILDCGKKIQQGVEVYEWVLIKEVYSYMNDSKQYTTCDIYRVLGIDEQGLYYEATIKTNVWSTFNILNPSQSDTLSLVYPNQLNNLEFIPFTAISSESLKLVWESGYIQNLIDISYHIFALDAELRASLQFQANPFLFVSGSNMKPTDVIQGMYSVNILKDATASMQYVAPPTNGMVQQESKLQSMHDEAVEQIYSILHVTATGASSGEALALRINSATTSLISLVKNIGDGIENTLKQVAIIMNLNPNKVVYKTYTGFSEIQSGTPSTSNVE